MTGPSGRKRGNTMIYDIAIIGAGPRGLTAAIYGQRAGLRTINFEANVHGGQIINTPEVENYPALGKISGVEFATNLYMQALDFGADIRYEEVTGVRLEGDIKKVTTAMGEYEAKTVIIATGVTRRKLEIPGEETMIGRGVSYCATCDGTFFRNKTAVVVGGGNTALEDAGYLSGLCSKVYLIHRRDEFRAVRHEVAKVVNNEKIEILYSTIPLEILGETKVTGLKVQNRVTGEERILDTDAVFVAVGLIPHNDMFAGQVEMKDGYILSDESCTTSIPGVFAAGDTRTKGLRQLVTAASDGAVAATAAYNYIRSL